MTKNMEVPVKLAASVVAHFKKGAASILEACTEIANAFIAFEEGAWAQADFVSFFDQLAEANIGAGSSVFMKTDSKGITTFDGKLKAGVYFQMMSVGRCPGFKTPEFVSANRISSYATLYRLTVLYNLIAEKASGNAEKKREKAQKAILELVERFGVGLTRKDVDEAIVDAQKERRSRAPTAPTSNEEAQVVAFSGEVKLTELLARDERYDLVVLTPTEEFLAEAEASSFSTLMDRAPYQDLRKAQSQAILVGSGRHMAGLKKLAEVSGDLTHCYCVRSKPDASAVIDISKELLVFSSAPLDGKATIAKGETADQFVRRLVTEGANPNTKKLHLFADQQAEGWDTCGVENSTKEG